jgi:serine/threonine protein kinase
MSTPDNSPSFPPGAVALGKLRIVGTIGVGGMGVVYEVEHELTKHRRALKVLHARAAQQPGVLERFLREASAAGRIGNAHVAETFDAGRLDTGEPYLLMELVDGETLDQRVQRVGPLGAGELADLVHQACEGLQAAHEAGIVHRDLKPENLIVTTREGAPFVKILDFGISKFDSERTGTLGITTEGLVMGTPYYMSPEQVRAGPIDARTDVYSLGVILYECACGVRPFDARSVEALAVLIHEGRAVPLQERRPSLPPAFCAVVHHAMAAERERRFASARALGSALEPMRVRTLHASTVPPPRAVVRLSTPAPASPSDGPISAVVPSTDAALAATMGTVPPPRVERAVRRGLAVGALALGSAAIAAFVITRSGGAPATTAAPTTIAPDRVAAPPVAPLTPVTLSPPAASASAIAEAGPGDSPLPIPSSMGVPRTGSPSASAVSSAPSAQAVPSAKPGTKTRVDQTGLAGENPFR